MSLPLRISRTVTSHSSAAARVGNAAPARTTARHVAQAVDNVRTALRREHERKRLVRLLPKFREAFMVSPSPFRAGVVSVGGRSQQRVGPGERELTFGTEGGQIRPGAGKSQPTTTPPKNDGL